MRLRLARTRKPRLFSSKNCLIEVVFSVVIRSSKKTGRRPLGRLKVEVFGAYGGRKQDGGEQSFTRLTALASKGSADIYIYIYTCIWNWSSYAMSRTSLRVCISPRGIQDLESAWGAPLTRPMVTPTRQQAYAPRLMHRYRF